QMLGHGADVGHAHGPADLLQRGRMTLALQMLADESKDGELAGGEVQGHPVIFTLSGENWQCILVADGNRVRTADGAALGDLPQSFPRGVIPAGPRTSSRTRTKGEPRLNFAIPRDQPD